MKPRLACEQHVATLASGVTHELSGRSARDADSSHGAGGVANELCVVHTERLLCLLDEIGERNRLGQITEPPGAEASGGIFIGRHCLVRGTFSQCAQRPDRLKAERLGKLLIDPRPGAVVAGVWRVDGDARLNQIQQHLSFRIRIRDLLDSSKQHRVMRHHQLRFPVDGLARDVRSQRETRHDARNIPRLAADQQPGVVPVLGKKRRCELAQKREHFSCMHSDSPAAFPFTNPTGRVTDDASLDNLNSTRFDPLMTAHFVTHRRVEFSDTDMAGIIHFASYYRYMEEAEHQFFRSLGLSVMRKHDEHTILGWPRVSASCSFEAPARFEDVLRIQVTVERKGVKSLTMRYEFFLDPADQARSDEQKRVAHGRMKIACCLCRHDQPLESIPIPAEIEQLLPESEDGSEP